MKLLRSSIVLGMALSVLVGATGCDKADRAAPPPQQAAGSLAPTPTPGPTPSATRDEGKITAGRALEVQAEIDATVPSAGDATRLAGTLERYADEHRGFVASEQLGDAAASTPAARGATAHVTLRVPARDLPGVRAALATGGPGVTITRESATATDVTEALADLDARVRNAKKEEERLLKLLEERTGNLADVLTAEHALADVRERIEKLEAEQRVAQGKVDLATVDVWLRAPASAGATAAPPTALARLRAASRDGVEAAEEVTMTFLGVALRGGPTALLFAAFGWSMVALLRRVLRRRAIPAV